MTHATVPQPREHAALPRRSALTPAQSLSAILGVPGPCLRHHGPLFNAVVDLQAAFPSLV